ncbi:hypothetical protein PIB30_033533 [Stylosanthes scabra]|uniref:B-like cyclin n=1 Tax=Stylosanthes scabra TaxID=79078 RepID=A0ABU6SCT4_9FABA|nr:hypothetical protein [Stylosanthes scabra]
MSPTTPSLLDTLLCQEEHEDTFENDDESPSFCPTKLQPFPRPVLHDNDLFWEPDELASLISKEEDTHADHDHRDGLRVGPVAWITNVCGHYGFSALTTVLAVNYFDRFVTSLTFQSDKPWMTQLTAVACLSLAAKMEETHVEESRFVFEAKTIQRMELLVLSTFKWRMHPVTPISFFEHIVRRLGLKSRLHWEFLWRCERVLLGVIADSRVMSYRPSTLAAATMIHVIKEIEPFNATEYINELLGLLKISEEQVNQCYKILLKSLVCDEGVIDGLNQKHKRRRLSGPGSPGGFIDSSFSCDCSNDLWAMATSSVSHSVEPLFKRSRAKDQQMRLPSVSRVSIDVLDSPR